MDDLARIERIYGSVAEYYREEWEAEEEPPTEEQIADSERRMEEYYAKIKQLNGTPSHFVRELIDKWETTKPQYDGTNESISAGWDWSRERTLAIVEELANHYGVTVDENSDTFYRVPANQFAISVEYSDHGRIYYKFFGNLDFEQFKNVYRDLWYARLWPTMSHNGLYVGNCSLGSLLYGYIGKENANG